MEVTRGVPEKFTVCRSDFLLGDFYKKSFICVQVNGSCEKFNNVSIHAFPQTNVGGVVLFFFTSDRLGLKFPS